MSGLRPTGWHPDPRNSLLERWWEDNAWTPLVRPVLRARDESPHDAGEPKPPRGPMSTDAKRAMVIAVLTGLVFAAWGYAGFTTDGARAETPPTTSAVETATR